MAIPSWIARLRAQSNERARADNFSSCANDWTVPPAVNASMIQSSDTWVAEDTYARRATGDETEDCGCAPCGSKDTNVHIGCKLRRWVRTTLHA